ncbi:MAG: hypothetical protein PHH18_10060 [Acidobacteriota bacterium]|nr:hypothetical protein [Acidobacteriota bacterium]
MGFKGATAWTTVLSRSSPETWFRRLSGGLIFLALVQVLTIALSLAHIVISQAAALAVLAAAAAGAWGFDRLFRRFPETGPNETAAPSPLAPILRGVIPILLALLGLTVIVAYFHPYLFGDCLIYHLPAVHYWSEKGFVHWVAPQPLKPFFTDLFINGYPKAAELMGFVVVQATGISGLVHLLNAWFLAIGISGTALIASSLGASAEASLTAGLLFALAPVHIQQLNGTYVDSAFASAVVALFAVLSRLAAGTRGRFAAWDEVAVFGAGAGLVLGLKSSGILPAGVAGAAAVIVLGLRRRRLPAESRRAANLRTWACIPVVFLISALVGGYWYARNLAHTGNPAYPLTLKIGDPGRSAKSVDFILNKAANTPPVIRNWPGWKQVAYVWMQGGPAHWPYSVCSASGRLGGLGLLWLLGCLPAVILACLTGKKSGPPPGLRRARITLLLCAALVFLLTPMHWWARYTVWPLGIGLPFLVLVLDKFWESRGRKWIASWAILLAAVFLAETAAGIMWLAGASGIDWYGGQTAFPAERKIGFDRLTWSRPFMTIDETRRGAAYRRMKGDFEPVLLGPLNQQRVLSPPMTAMFGMVCDPLGRRRVFVTDFPRLQGLRKLRRFLRENKIRYAIWDASAAQIPPFDRLCLRKENDGTYRYFIFEEPEDPAGKKETISPPLSAETVKTAE